MDPAPERAGIGILDRLIGPGSTGPERLRIAAAAFGGLCLGGLTVSAPLPATLALALMTAELTAGIACSLTDSGKAWQHRPTRTPLDHLLVAALNLIPMALFVWLFRDGDPVRLAVASIFLIGGAIAVQVAPSISQRAVGLVGVLVAMVTLEQTVGLVREAAWFLPLLYTRVLIAYLPAPRPPETETP
ncbi:MAG TPA: hypothetical protein VLA56_09300 [Pseudomonadales bacterium]|nr:hypothetical protein [Pseudomonadales bacterium]